MASWPEGLTWKTNNTGYRMASWPEDPELSPALTSMVLCFPSATLV